MSRKFQFKPSNTGDLVAVEVVDDENWYFELYHNYSQVGSLVPSIVLHSNDWQEITEPELVEGRWYINNSGDVFRIKEFCGDVKVDNFVWSDGVIYYDGEFVPPEGIKREATPEEIHKALEAIRLHKELVEGTQVVDVLNAGKYKIGNKDSFYVKEQDCLYKRSFNGKINIPLYWEGQWAEKVEEPILVTEDGYKVYDKNEPIWFVFDGWPYDDYELDKRSINQTCNLEKQCIFYKKENAEYYIEYNKPRYSNKDLDNLLIEIINRTRETKVNHNTVKDLIDNLKALRND